MRLVNIFLLVIAALIACPDIQADAKEVNLTIAYSGSNHGETDPCG